MRLSVRFLFVIFIAFFIRSMLANERDDFYTCSFDSEPFDWTLAGQFAIGTPGASNLCTTPHSATNVLGTNLTGNYSPDQPEADNYALSPVINVSGGENLKLTYWSFSQFHRSYQDAGLLYISVDGLPWILIDRVDNYLESRWTKHYVDISAYADGHTQVQFRFSFYSDSSNQATGWNIDDFAVLEAEALPSSISINPAILPGGGNYTSFTAAIDDINLHGVGASGLLVNVSAGSVFTEEIPPLVASGNGVSAPIRISKAGVGVNPIIRSNGYINSDDGAFTLWGASYVVIDGIDIESNSDYLEYGYSISTNDNFIGSSYIDISNCNITILNSLRTGHGIRQEVLEHPLDATGTNSFNSYHHNTITTASGISLINIHILIVPPFYDNSCRIYANTINGYPNGIPSQIPSAFLGISAIGYEGVEIYDNEISHFYTSEAGIGIQAMWGANGSIYRNRIHDLALNCDEAGFFIAGIKAGDCRIYNNMIYNLNSNKVDAADQFSVRGIVPEAHSNVSFNTVNLGSPGL